MGAQSHGQERRVVGHATFITVPGAPLGRSLEALLQGCHIGRHLPSGLASNEEWHEEPTDSVALEVEGDRQLRGGVGARFDSDVNHGADGPVHAADAPMVRGIEADQLSSGRSVSETDVPD